MGFVGLCAGLAIGCGGSPDADGRNPYSDIDIEQTTVVSETGCLTSSGDRYVLTALETDGNRATELYQLIGDDAELRQHVGREVRVTGDAEPPQVAEVREVVPPGPTGTAGTDSAQQGDAQVSATTQTRLETRPMRVATITPTGTDCASGAAAQ
jgi:hypothetical protein